MPRKVAIALGSNLGDRRAALAFATERLAVLIADLTVSDIVETEPEGAGLEDQPLFLNAAVVGDHDARGARAPRRPSGHRARLRARAPVSRRPADARPRPDSARRRARGSAGAPGAASPIQNTVLRPRAARRHRAGSGGSGDWPEGGGVAPPAPAQRLQIAGSWKLEAGSYVRLPSEPPLITSAVR